MSQTCRNKGGNSTSEGNLSKPRASCLSFSLQFFFFLVEVVKLEEKLKKLVA